MGISEYICLPVLIFLWCNSLEIRISQVREIACSWSQVVPTTVTHPHLLSLSIFLCPLIFLSLHSCSSDISLPNKLLGHKHLPFRRTQAKTMAARWDGHQCRLCSGITISVAFTCAWLGWEAGRRWSIGYMEAIWWWSQMDTMTIVRIVG